MKNEGDPVVANLIAMFSRRVSDRRMEILSLFEDHAGMRWASPGHVTVSQFARAIDMLGFRLKREEMEAVCRVYCDTEIKNEFNYVEFCAAVDPISGRDCRAKGMSEEARKYYESIQGKREPKPLMDKANQNPYYDKFGRVKPLVTEGDMSARRKQEARRENAMLKLGMTPRRASVQEEISHKTPRRMDKLMLEVHRPPETALEKMGVNEEGIAEDIKRIQHNIFRRRIRAKEVFRDFDPRRTGICTAEQFSRGVAHIIHPNLLNDPETPIDVEALSKYFKADVRGPPSVQYGKFCKVVDAMFKPGDLLDMDGFKPRKVRDEAGLQKLLRKLEHLIEVHAIDLNTCFNDCGRSDTDMRSGRVDPQKFLYHFPLARFTPTQPAKISKADMELLIQRYTDDNGWMRLFAFIRDIEAVKEDKLDPAKNGKLKLPILTPRTNQEANTIYAIVGKLGL